MTSVTLSTDNANTLVAKRHLMTRWVNCRIRPNPVAPRCLKRLEYTQVMWRYWPWPWQALIEVRNRGSSGAAFCNAPPKALETPGYNELGADATAYQCLIAFGWKSLSISHSKGICIHLVLPQVALETNIFVSAFLSRALSIAMLRPSALCQTISGSPTNATVRINGRPHLLFQRITSSFEWLL